MDFEWLLIPASFIVGGFPTARLIGYLVGHDPTAEGSGNPGATNMFRIAGTRAGIATLMVDVLKALLVTLVGRAVGGMPLGMFCGAAATMGHMFPLPDPRRGGKGVACFGGMTIGAWPILGAIGLAIWALAARLSGRSFIGAMVAVPMAIAGTTAIGRPWSEVAVTAVLATVIVLRHRRNISAWRAERS